MLFLIYFVRATLCALYTAILSAPAVILGLLDRSGESVVRIARLWVRGVLGVCRIRIVTEGLENVPRTSPVIFMANHQSVFDIVALIATLPVSWRFVAKRELAWIPLFGWALVTSGQILVNRRDRVKAVRSLARGAERVRAGTNVIVFPEGTRSESGALRPFKSGGFHLAIQAQVPIVPVAVSGSRRITPKKSLRINSGTLKVVFGAPIPTRGLGVNERELLKERVRKGIEAGYDRSLQEPSSEESSIAASG